MLNRAAAAVLGTALILVALSQLFQEGTSFEISHLGWALVFCIPLGLSVMLGSLGTTRLEYPNATFGVLTFWIANVGPWLITDEHDFTLHLPYSDQAVFLGRMFFLAWCLLFTIAAGRPSREIAQITPSTVDVVGLCIPIMLSLASQLARGQFTDYQGGAVGDTQLVIAMSMGKKTLAFLPGLFLFVANRGRSPTVVWLSRIAGIAGIPLMLLAGGRSPIVFATGYGSLFARLSGVRFRFSIAAGAVLAVPLCFLFVFTYRSALSNTETGLASLRELTSIASDTAGELAEGGEGRGQAVVNFSQNVRVRMGIGPQFYAVVDSWLAKGPAFEGTFLDGLISVLPVYFFPEKNQIAVNHNLEFTLQRQGILPEVDLSPTPWMHWLYEFGLIGMVVGAVLAGRLVRFLERRLIRTRSMFELVFWTYLLSAIYPAEITVDAIFLVVRDAAVLVTFGWVLSITLRLMTTLTRAGSAQPSDISSPNVSARVQP